MLNNQNKKIIVGIVGHIEPRYLPELKQELESFSYFRLIRFVESDNKLWIVEREEQP